MSDVEDYYNYTTFYMSLIFVLPKREIMKAMNGTCQRSLNTYTNKTVIHKMMDGLMISKQQCDVFLAMQQHPFSGRYLRGLLLREIRTMVDPNGFCVVFSL